VRLVYCILLLVMYSGISTDLEPVAMGLWLGWCLPQQTWSHFSSSVVVAARSHCSHSIYSRNLK